MPDAVSMYPYIQVLKFKGCFTLHAAFSRHLTSAPSSSSSTPCLRLYKHGEPLLYFLTSFLLWKTSFLIFSFFSFLLVLFLLCFPRVLTCCFFLRDLFCSFVIHHFYGCGFLCVFPDGVTRYFDISPLHAYVRAIYFGSVCDTRWSLPSSSFLLLLLPAPSFFLLTALILSSSVPFVFFLHLHLSLLPPSPSPLPPTSRDSAALVRGRGWSRRTWAACCRCVTSGWTPASCTHCPCWPSARTSWWCGSSSAWLTSWPNCAAAEPGLKT